MPDALGVRCGAGVREAYAGMTTGNAAVGPAVTPRKLARAEEQRRARTDASADADDGNYVMERCAPECRDGLPTLARGPGCACPPHLQSDAVSSRRE